MSAADATCTRPVNNATQATSRRALKLGIVKSPYFDKLMDPGRTIVFPAH
jgi:hypothetical protein